MHFGAIAFQQFQYFSAPIFRVLRLLDDATEKKTNPLKPSVCLTDGKKMIRILLSVPVKVSAEVEQRFGEQVSLAQE